MLKIPTFFDSICTTGLAAGNSKEEAIIQAAAEVIERHVYHKTYYNLPRVNRIDLESIDNPLLKGMINSLKEKGFEILAHDLSDSFAMPSISTFVFNPKEKLVFPGPFKVGTSTDPQIALTRALTEYIQGRSSSLNKGIVREHPDGFFASREKMLGLYDWLSKNENTVSIKDIKGIACDDFKEEVELIAKDLKKKSLNFLAYDLTHPKIGIPVMRVTIPSLQPNFLVRDLSPFNKRSCVTPHLNIYEQVMERMNNRSFDDQDIDEVVEI